MVYHRLEENEMIRIGVLGTDNSHSIGFSRMFNVKGEKGHIRGGRVVAVFGLDEARTKEVAEKGRISTIVKRPKDMIGMIDAAIVDFRRGSQHYRYSKPLIEAGIPTFIDKPFASSTADAKKIVRLARKHRVPITNFSTVRFGKGMADFKRGIKKIGRVGAVVISGPGSTKDPYDGIFFYAVHQVELMLEAFGHRVKSARGIDHNGTLVASVLYKNGMIVTMHEINTGWPVFRAAAYGKEGEAHYDGSKAHDGFLLGAKVFTKMFKTGKMPFRYDDLTISTRVLVAIRKSMEAGGGEVAIR